MKKGQINETWTEVDLTQFKKENPKYAAKPSYYQALIMEAVNCDKDEAIIIEDYMRHIYFHSTLDWQTKEQLVKAAKESCRELKLLAS